MCSTLTRGSRTLSNTNAHMHQENTFKRMEIYYKDTDEKHKKTLLACNQNEGKEAEELFNAASQALVETARVITQNFHIVFVLDESCSMQVVNVETICERAKTRAPKCRCSIRQEM